MWGIGIYTCITSVSNFKYSYTFGSLVLMRFIGNTKQDLKMKVKLISSYSLPHQGIQSYHFLLSMPPKVEKPNSVLIIIRCLQNTAHNCIVVQLSFSCAFVFSILQIVESIFYLASSHKGCFTLVLESDCQCSAEVFTVFAFLMCN